MVPEEHQVPASDDEPGWESIEPDEDLPTEETDEEREERVALEQLRRRKPR